MGKNLRRLIPLLSLILFIIAFWVLHQKLKEFNYHEVMHAIKKLPGQYLLLAFCLTIVSYLLLTGYDSLSLYFIKHPIPYGKIVLTSFISYAFSQNIGLPILSGGTVRYRLYSGWRLSALEIGKVIIFNSLTFIIGFLSVGGAVFLLNPLIVPAELHLPFFRSLFPLGFIFLILVGFYLLGNLFLRKRPLSIWEQEFSFPSIGISLTQIVLSSSDWIISAGVLYVLLPSHSRPSFPYFLSIFMLAQIAGFTSQIPGGLGVFEAIVLVFLSPALPASVIMGSLLVYRGIYYLLPLGAAIILLGTYEVFERKERVKKVARFFGRLAPEIVPDLMAFAIFIGGVVLLFSGATPASKTRILLLGRFLPLPVMEISHFLGSLAGLGLILLAVSLQRRIDAAFILASFLLGTGILLSLLKGFDYEEAIILGIILCSLLPSRRHFYRKASLISQRFTPGWIIAISLALLSSAWLGLFSFKHIEYSNQMWWQFTLRGDAPRFLRAMVGAIGVTLFFTVYRLLNPGVRLESLVPSSSDMDRIRGIVKESPEPTANLALLGDKSFLISQSGKSFIMYGIEGRSWVALGDPIGPKEERVNLAWAFHEMVDRYRGWTVFYEIHSENLPLYLDLGLSLLKFGEEGRIPVESFSLEGSARKWLRYIHHKLEKEKYIFEIVPPENVPALLTRLKTISDSWLKEKNTREKGFSLGFFKPEYLIQFPLAIIRKNGKIISFANIWPSSGKEEFSIDLMRYTNEAPQGTMDYLFTHLIIWGKKEGYRWLNLGLAPLSGLEDRSLAPLWNRLGAFVFRHGEHFYNFQGLRKYKEKFDPVWEPKYIALPGGVALPRILANVASLVSGGIKGVVAR
jgi:phosphatidylglycerol lysyltransferase